jgi:predicted aspartyl protease
MRLLNDGHGEPESRRERRQGATPRCRGCRAAFVFIAMAMAPGEPDHAQPSTGDVRLPESRNSQAAATSGPALSGATPIEVPLETERGTFVIPVRINDTLTLKFTLDSGASDVSIPADVVSTLVRSGTIARDDFIGNQTSILADGSTIPSPEFRIRSLRFGNLEIRDVIVSVAPTSGLLLLGQSFLTRLSGWSIDNERRLLILIPAEAAEPLSGTPSATATAVPDVRDAPPTSPEMNLLCRVRETRPGGAHRELRRRIELDLATKTVRYYDDVGQGWVFKREGPFVSADAHRIVLDADGNKDAYIDRLSGEYAFHNQRDGLTISGQCEKTGEFGQKF